MKQPAHVVLSVLLACEFCSAVAHYGPNGCVRLGKSAASTCVLTTDCTSVDLSKFEFAFDCEDPRGGTWTRYSFGHGGFDAQEEYDTELVCRTCAEPTTERGQRASRQETPSTPAHVPPQPAPADVSDGDAPIVQAIASKSHAANRRHATQLQSRGYGWADPSANYGPNRCVSTYKSPEGHCILQTQCSQEEISDYELGFICVSKEGIPVRQIFGKGSFEPVETFDTLIVCDQCLGLEDVPLKLLLKGRIHYLATYVNNLEESVANLTEKVDALLPSSPSSAPSPSPAPGPVTSAAPVQLAAAKPSQYIVEHLRRSHLRGSRRHRIREDVRWMAQAPMVRHRRHRRNVKMSHADTGLFQGMVVNAPGADHIPNVGQHAASTLALPRVAEEHEAQDDGTDDDFDASDSEIGQRGVIESDDDSSDDA